MDNEGKKEINVDPTATESPVSGRIPMRVPVPRRNRNILKYGSSLETPKPGKETAPSAPEQADASVGARVVESFTEGSAAQLPQDAATTGSDAKGNVPPKVK